jgi:hypothetical protein
MPSLARGSHDFVQISALDTLAAHRANAARL